MANPSSSRSVSFAKPDKSQQTASTVLSIVDPVLHSILRLATSLIHPADTSDSSSTPDTKTPHDILLQSTQHLVDMSRIQIPLDVLTSRLNLSERFEGLRSGPVSGRFSNLRPVGEFLDFKRFSKPANFGEMQSRVNYNLGYFSTNYAVVFAMLSIYALLTNWLLLFDIIFVAAGMFLIGRLEGRDLEIGTFRATSSQLYTGLLIIAVPLGLIASPFSTLLWLIGASGVAILGHASFMDKPIDEAFSGEAV